MRYRIIKGEYDQDGDDIFIVLSQKRYKKLLRANSYDDSINQDDWFYTLPYAIKAKQRLIKRDKEMNNNEKV